MQKCFWLRLWQHALDFYFQLLQRQIHRSGSLQRILVIGADKMSPFVDYEDRQTCIIFGDGAGAVLIEPSEDDTGTRFYYEK